MLQANVLENGFLSIEVLCATGRALAVRHYARTEPAASRRSLSDLLRGSRSPAAVGGSHRRCERQFELLSVGAGRQHEANVASRNGRADLNKIVHSEPPIGGPFYSAK